MRERERGVIMCNDCIIQIWQFFMSHRILSRPWFIHIHHPSVYLSGESTTNHVISLCNTPLYGIIWTPLYEFITNSIIWIALYEFLLMELCVTVCFSKKKNSIISNPLLSTCLDLSKIPKCFK